MSSPELRKIRDRFWKSKNHAWAPPASLIVNSADDPTTMFNTAGMQPLVPYLMGKEHPTWSTRVYNIQWCVRTVDIDEVGDVSHLTFFEMMWNWSLGDYFKKEAISRSWEFLTWDEWLGFDPKNLAVSVFEWDADAPRDEVSVELWKEQGVTEWRIAYLWKKDNRWWPAGAMWPCGPDTEIFYWIGEWEAPEVFDPEKDDENWLEIWNNVFMWYYKDENGTISEMEKKNVDTWMGFERILMVSRWIELKKSSKISAINELSVYDSNLFDKALTLISSFGITDLRRKRIVADHIRTAMRLLDEGLSSSNEWRWYILRRIMRRAMYQFYLWKDSLDLTVIEKQIHDILLSFHATYPETNIASVLGGIMSEWKWFDSTVRQGKKKLDELMKWASSWMLDGKDVFQLFDTYGFPWELTEEILAENNLTYDQDQFEKAKKNAVERSRASWDKFSKTVNRAEHIQWLPETTFLWYDTLECNEATLLKDFEVEWSRFLVFDCSPFYAESWGQKWDSWEVALDTGEKVKIVDVQKYGGVWLHKVG